MTKDVASIWFCIEDGCDERGEGTMAECDKAADDHTTKGNAKHCTATMSVADAEVLTRALQRNEHG